jgi:hypothetical protein
MATKFSGGTYVNTTFAPDSRANLIANVVASLNTAGWSNVGTVNTSFALLQTAQDPDSNNQGRVMLSANGSTCVQVTISNVSNTKIQVANTINGIQLLQPASAKTWRILASRYRFEIFTPGSTAAREFAMAGILWIPTPYQGVITEAIYAQGNAVNDGDTSLRNSFRTYMLNKGNNAGIINGNLMEVNNVGYNYSGGHQLRLPCSTVLGSSDSGIACQQNMYRWHDNALDMADPLMGWSTSDISGEALIRGQLYDWVVISDTFTSDSTDSWNDGGAHNFFCLMSYAGSGGNAPRGSFWVAYS